MTDLSTAKPGDLLYIWGRMNQRLDKVDRITPTGRVVLKNGEQFNADGSRRGDGPYSCVSARVATEDDIAGIYRANLVNKLRHFPWDKLKAADLKTVGEIVKNSDVK